MKTRNIAIFYAILAAALYAINVPLSKLLLNNAQPTMMASFLYLGAGLGLFLYSLIEKAIGKEVKREPLTRKELPYTIAMVVLDIAAPILLMFGISMKSFVCSLCHNGILGGMLHLDNQVLIYKTNKFIVFNKVRFEKWFQEYSR